MNNIPTNLNVAAQLPNDPKTWILSSAFLADLGISNNLAYTYYKGMRVYCATEQEIWEWREVTTPGETGGLVVANFVYPAGLVVNGVDYGTKEYNFFNVLQASDIDTIAAQNVGGGIESYKDVTIAAGVQTFNFRTFVSDTLDITEDGDKVRAELVPDLNNLAFYVNVNSIVPTEDGTEVKPFKTLNKALDTFIGTGTWYNPQYKGYKIQLLSACSVLQTGTVDYNGYDNLDINNLDIVGNGFYLGLYANPSVDYYPISTRRMVAAMPKTAGVLDYAIDIRITKTILQRAGTNAIVDNLNYSFPTANLVGAFPPVQNSVLLWITECTLTNDTDRLLSGNFSLVPNPNDAGNPLLMFGVPVYASNTEPWGVPMVKTEGRNWNKEGGFRLGDGRLNNTSGTAFRAVNTTYQDYYKFNEISTGNYFRLYESEVSDYYSPRLNTALIELEDVNYFSVGNTRFNWTVPTMITTEGIPRNSIVGGLGTLFKLVNSNAYITGDSSEQDQFENLVKMDGTSGISLQGYQNNGAISDVTHGMIQVVAPLPVTASPLSASGCYLYYIKTDETGVDKSFIQGVYGSDNYINNAPHNTNSHSYANDVDAKTAGLIVGSIYYNTTVGALKRIL
jgi:hypothetical protein